MRVAAFAFAKGVLVGTPVGAAPLLLLSIPLGVQVYANPLGAEPSIWTSLLFVAGPLALGFPFVLAGALLLGLPTFWILRKLNQTAPPVYALYGGI